MLNGDWNVALAEIHYPYSFFNVQEGQNKIKIKKLIVTEKFIERVKQAKKITPKELEKDFKQHSVTCMIKPGFYASIKMLISAVNDAILEATKNGNFFLFNADSQRVLAAPSVVKEGNMLIMSILLSERLSLQLGYTPNEEISENNCEARHVANSSIGVPDKMLIYCDIIEPQIIGDKCSKVLRTCNITPDGAEPYFGYPCSRDFIRLQYIPLQKRHFESISIDIRDITGKLLPFQYGTSSVKLHFKQN